jgi:oligoendopeptidase F
VREQAWTKIAAERLKHRAKIDELFDQTLPLRNKIAVNAGCRNYIEFCFKQKKRFDYTPADCNTFADAVEKSVMPVLRKLQEKRKKLMGLDKLRPWDLLVDPKGRPPLRPFDMKDTAGLVSKTREVFNRISPSLANDFDQLSKNNNLDLDSREGKQPGGYQSSLEESQQPFIFMNAAGVHRDVETLLHEGGHAFHYQWAAASEPLVFLRQAPMEFCEVASMSMELLGMEHFDVYYNSAEEYKRAQVQQLAGNAQVLAWIATIDQFQHWLYSNPGHTVQQRTDHWLSLMQRFGGDADYTGHEDVLAALWHRQLHIFHLPFYYIEYGIAQLGALQLWLKAKDDPKQALSNYRAALSLGGTRSLPDLFKAAGLQFDFSNKTIAPLMHAVMEEIESLEA